MGSDDSECEGSSGKIDGAGGASDASSICAACSFLPSPCQQYSFQRSRKEVAVVVDVIV